MNAISLFAGAGGMDVGVSKAGFKVVAASELDKYACDTYEKNHPSTKLFRGDILDHINELCAMPNVDIVFGGPPCQGFSVAGKMDADDPRSKLVFTFCDVIENVSPKAFIMENVKSLGTLSKFQKVRDKIIYKMENAGYVVSMHILNSRDFGVPQSRERVFFIGLKKDYKKVNTQMFASFLRPAKTLREAIYHLGPAGSEKNAKVTKAKITLANKPILRKSPYAGMLFNGQGRPLNPDSWSSTLPASMGGNRTPIIDEKHLYENQESWIEKYHSRIVKGMPSEIKEVPSFLRRLTVEEAAILQTFPISYEFCGPQSKVFSQIGNAVPCDLAYVVASVVKKSILYASPKELEVDHNYELDFY